MKRQGQNIVSPEGKVLVRNEAGPNGGAHVKVLTPDGLEHVCELARNGHNMASIAYALGIAKNTWKAMRDRQPEIDEALEYGHTALAADLTSILIERIHKYPQNATYLIFALKTLCGFKEGEATLNIQQINHITNNILKLPEKISDDKLTSLVETATVEADDE